MCHNANRVSLSTVPRPLVFFSRGCAGSLPINVPIVNASFLIMQLTNILLKIYVLFPAVKLHRARGTALVKQGKAKLPGLSSLQVPRVLFGL